MTRQLNRIASFVALLCVALASCSKDAATEPTSTPGEGIRLELSAALGEGFGAAAKANSGDTKAPIFGSSFPAGTHTFSLAILNGEATGVFDNNNAYSNIKAEVTVSANGLQTWRYQLQGSSAWINFLALPQATVGTIKITALYPYNASAVFDASMGCLALSTDLSSPTADQTDIMYVPPTALTIASFDRSKALLLSFKHLFALFEFQIAPIFSDPCKISQITLRNSSSVWVENKGTVYSSGSFGNTSAGPIAVDYSQSMTMGVYNTYRIMIPQPSTQFASYQDDNGIKVYFIDRISPNILLPLTIKREWLEPTGGVKAGKRYSFRILYANAATGGPAGMTVTDWSVNPDSEDFWGTPSPADGYLHWNLTSLITSGSFNGTTYTLTGPSSFPYNGYSIGSDVSSNGGYYTVLADVPDEPVSLQLEVAKSSLNYSDWTTAWAQCKALTPAGAWRLPRMSELMLMYLNRTELAKTPGFNALTNVLYWSGTERTEGSTWQLNFATGAGTSLVKAEKGNVRCVRELLPPPPTPVVEDYYYTDGTWSRELNSRKTVEGVVFWVDPTNPWHFKIVSMDEPPASWDGGTNTEGCLPWSTEQVTTNATSASDGKANTLTLMKLTNANLYRAAKWCFSKNTGLSIPAASSAATSDANYKWYLPATDELQHIFCAYRGAAPTTWASGTTGVPPAAAGYPDAWNARFAGKTAFASASCWTSTESNSTLSWYVYFTSGYTGSTNKTSAIRRTRCVREITITIY